MECIDFLKDDKFVEWLFLQSEESEKYWRDFIERHPECKDELDKAVLKYKAVRFNDNELPQHIEEELLDRIRKSIAGRNKNRNKIPLKRVVRIAAAVFAAAVCTVFFGKYFSGFNERFDDASIGVSHLPDEEIKLVSGGNIVALEKDADLKLTAKGDIHVKNSNGLDSSLPLTKNMINKIIVPYGKRSTLELPDGSRIWLNSGTELEFPTVFSERERRIGVKGEIYIEVAGNDRIPFYVDASGFCVRVYGTAFNLSCYEGQSESSVVLVEGSVGVEGAEFGSIRLAPSEKFEKDAAGISKTRVNTEEYCSWKDGILIFYQTSISDILLKLEKYYNVALDVAGKPELMQKTCSGRIVLSDDVDDVIKSISPFLRN